MSAKGTSGTGKSMAVGTTVAVPTMEGGTTPFTRQGTSGYNEEEECAHSNILQRGSPHHVTYQVNGSSSVWENLQEHGISHAGKDLIMASWRSET